MIYHTPSREAGGKFVLLGSVGFPERREGGAGFR